MRLVSLNIFSGRSPSDLTRGRENGPIDAQTLSTRLHDAVAALDPDVLALQEVDRGQPRSAFVDQARVAAAAMGAVEMRFVPAVAGTPGEPDWHAANPWAGTGEIPDTDGPRYGVALLSRLPVRRWHITSLPAARGRYPLPVSPQPPRVLWLRDEPRVAVAVELGSPRLTVATTHLSFVPGANVRQLRRVRRWLGDLPGPQLLTGDLNIPGRGAGWASGWTRLLDAPTFPVGAPRVQLDHALTPHAWLADHVFASTVDAGVGDHRALVLEISLPA